jgi:hypothetical protein
VHKRHCPPFDRIWTDCIQEETRLVSREDMDGMVKSSSDENQALAAALGRAEEVLQIEEVHQGEGLLPREKHLQSRDGRRILVRSDVLSVMIMVTMLHSVHTRGKRKKATCINNRG